ncbi:hypothetical protein L484_002169 [Morus notabilis]|uniref:acylphosphatase n=1 Tax=Morus notabilis TaxID=981085 RepID=W9QKU6_9ROSA|nr:uncharacterized protein LOC21385748 [Morus notabilis]EXB22444.1 hypothetical protein L484_002169 [Morus notabilis]
MGSASSSSSSSVQFQFLTIRPLILQHRRSRFFTSQSHHQWRKIQYCNGDRAFGLSHLHNPHRSSPNPLLPLRRRLLLPLSPLPPLLRPRPPTLRHPLSSMTTASLSSPNDHPSTKTVRVVVKGRVQGVFYRNWTIDNANELGLKGWVRNRRDGSVEALFSGNPNSVEEMQQRCRRGPPAAVITGLEVFPSTDDPGSGFDCKPTV